MPVNGHDQCAPRHESLATDELIAKERQNKSRSENHAIRGSAEAEVEAHQKYRDQGRHHEHALPLHRGGIERGVIGLRNRPNHVVWTRGVFAES